jgi:hypothetical protein
LRKIIHILLIFNAKFRGVDVAHITGKYLQDRVQLNSLRINYTQQIPEVNVSPEVEIAWANWRFVTLD